jgi:hypothetical protein
MAVGSFTDKFHAQHSLAAVWHNGRWQTINGTPGKGLETVTCASVWHCVATGTVKMNFVGQRFTYEVDGEPPWKPMTSPQRPLSPASCASLTFCMVIARVGNNVSGPVVEAWSGQTWKALPARTSVCTADGRPCALSDISCGSTANCVGVGYAQDNAIGGVRPEAAAWNGQKWAIEQPPAGSAQPSMDLADSCTGAFCLAIGSAAVTAGNGTPAEVLLASYNATTGKWQERPAGQTEPSSCGPSCFRPGSLSCGSPVNCMEFARYANLAWNGSVLRKAPSVSVGRGSLLGAVSCGTVYCLAVGHKTVKGKMRPLAELWNGTSWAIIKTP